MQTQGHFEKCSYSATSHEIERCERSVECVKGYQKDAITMFLHDLTEYDTALVQRQGDGTWMKTKERYRYKAGDDGQHALECTRSGGLGCDFYLHRLVVTSDSNVSAPLVLISEPRPMSKGKSSWHVFTAEQDEFTNCRDFGHSGFVVSWYCYDRLQFEAMMKIHRAFNRKACRDLTIKENEDELSMKISYVSEISPREVPAASMMVTTLSNGH